MITEKNVTWTCRSCLQFENCLRCHIRNDKTCEWFRPDQQYIDRSRILKKRKENEIMNKMPVARFIEIKATQEIGSCPCVSISAEVLIPQPCKIENIDNEKIKIAIEYAVATYVKIEEKKDFKK
jgi:hypothetical protein